jgi:hypothetical protein
MKKMLSLILALVLVLGLAANVWATEPGIVDEGTVNGVRWRLTEDGNLYLEHDLYNSMGTAPWEKYQEQITTITLGGTIYDTIYFLFFQSRLKKSKAAFFCIFCFFVVKVLNFRDFCDIINPRLCQIPKRSLP